jgi:hypothetical protein
MWHISAGQIVPSAVRPAIDETKSLPYKPRQLSAMTRLAWGGSILGRQRSALGHQRIGWTSSTI